MATSALKSRDRDKIPDWAKSTLLQIEKLGFRDWEFDWEYPVPDPATLQRVQIRDDAHNAPRSEVGKYANAMRKGAKFPPGVVTRDGRIVDFNTRAMAARKLGWLTFPCFVLPVSFDTASAFDRERIWLLGAAFNLTGPKPLTRTELVKAIRVVAANPDWDAAKVAEHLNCTPGTAQGIFAQFRAEQRAEKLGISLNGSITESNKAMLGQRSEKLTDRPFEEIAKLTQEAGLTSEELRDLCNRVQDEAGSEDAKLAVIRAERAAREAQIAHFKATAKKRPPESVNLRKRLGWITGFNAKLADLLDYNPATAAEYLKQVEEASALLQQLAEQQRTAIREAGVEAS
jgi:hypothetical protein